MTDSIESEPLPPPPPEMLPEPKAEDAFETVTGVVLPKKAKKYKHIFRFIGRFEIILGAYCCVFGIVSTVVSNYIFRNINLGVYAGICGVGAFMLASGGLKLLKYKNQCFMVTNMIMSFLSALLSCTVAGLCVWRIIHDKMNKKSGEKNTLLQQEVLYLTAAVAAIMIGIMIICVVHVGCYCAGSNVSMEPVKATMHRNIHTGEQIIEYHENEKDKIKREKRREKSFQKIKRDESFPVALNSPTAVRKQRENTPIPLTPIIQSGSLLKTNGPQRPHGTPRPHVTIQLPGESMAPQSPVKRHVSSAARQQSSIHHPQYSQVPKPYYSLQRSAARHEDSLQQLQGSLPRRKGSQGTTPHRKVSLPQETQPKRIQETD